jgi:hypothetical protein
LDEEPGFDVAIRKRVCWWLGQEGWIVIVGSDDVIKILFPVG